MLMRSMIGSLAAVGVIGALAAVLPEHNASKPVASAPSFGELPKMVPSSGSADKSDAVEAEKQSLIKLAAYSAPRDAPAPAPLVATPKAPTAPDISFKAPSLSSLDRGIAMTASASQLLTFASAAAAEPEPQPTSAASATPEPSPPAAAEAAPPQNVAALPPASAAPPAPTSPDRININRASVVELDHIPGGGRIGVAIARRRPYHAVDDLVRRRVLRASIFARIRSAITVD